MTATAELTGITLVPLEYLVPHPANRKRFDKTGLEELAKSLATSGQITPAIVRAATATSYEILAGERRWRAAKIAGLAQLAVIVRELSDEEALEIVAIENGQREDLDPIDEAELYKAMLTLKGYNVPKIAERLKHSETYIRERLRLLRLVPEARKLVIDGTIPVQHAILLAGLLPEDQKRALQPHRMNGSAYEIGGLFREERTIFDDERDTRVPVSVAEFRDWIRREVRLDPRAEIVRELFPETADAIAHADGNLRKVLSLTTDYRVADAAKDPKERTIGHEHWKRADGKQGSKSCQYAELGVVVTGEDQGAAFQVCVRKDKCAVHWPQQVKAAQQRAKEKAAADPDATGPAVEKVRAKTAAEQAKAAEEAAKLARWAKAHPQLRAALIAAVRKQPATADSKVGKHLLSRCWDSADLRKVFKPSTAADVVHFLLLSEIFDEEFPHEIAQPWDQERALKLLKEYGVDGKKIVDAVCPPAKSAAAPKAKKAAKKKAGAK